MLMIMVFITMFVLMLMVMTLFVAIDRRRAVRVVVEVVVNLYIEITQFHIVGADKVHKNSVAQIVDVTICGQETAFLDSRRSQVLLPVAGNTYSDSGHNSHENTG
jgi:hypothetical protein